MFAFALILTFSAVVSFVNYFILRFFIFLKRFRKSLAPRLDRWVNDGIFQIQRRAFEANDSPAWTGLDKEIPTTVESAPLTELNTNRRTIRRSATAATLVDKVTLEKWELEERQPTLAELNRSFSAISSTSTAERNLVSRGEVSFVERSAARQRD